MKLEEVWVYGKNYYFSGTGLAPDGDLYSDVEHKVGTIDTNSYC